MPGGHEFTSFVLGLYNAAGPGQALDPEVREKILGLKKTDMKVLVTLSCTMCPELVTAAQRIAEGEAEYMRILAGAYDTQEKKDFYEFTLALDALKASLTGEEKTVILDADSDLAKILMGAAG